MSTATLQLHGVEIDQQHAHMLERVHPYTLAFIQKMLSSKQFDSVQFLAHLLQLAEVKQQSIVPPTIETTNRAIIHLQSAQELSQRSGWPWGYTTTYKVLRVLEALGLLQRKPGELHFFYGAPQFHTDIFLNLQKLQASKTPKVRQLATKVQRRLERDVLHGQLRIFDDLPAASNAPVAQATQTFTTLLQQEGIAISPRLAAKLSATCEDIARMFAQVPLSVQQKEALAAQERPWYPFEGFTAEKQTQEGNFALHMGNATPTKQRQEKSSEGNSAQEKGNSYVTLVACGVVPLGEKV
ncbi:hypothetical protein [Ktedonospora formicarum]|uniref:Uncharacterized protein n=1 Tax=Ktedonospora formicarum TaxID=2778364 RepID=A0A8J3MVH8_9CHLR|nr:hypothetical protein [Ktedonospora formicarum]GHO50322.1 hypothetical protein KSX_84850 [Ktedonospora formicarum]